MKTKLFLAAALVLLATSAMAFGPTGKRITTPLQAREFNSIASQYMERPTHVNVKKVGTDLALWVEYDSYDPRKSDTYLIFSKKYVDDYLAHIDKYQEWNVKAMEAGDAFQKDIGKASSQAGFKLKFAFYSGNAQKHYLNVMPCVLLMCGTSGVYFDAENTDELERLLIQLRDGQLTAEDVSQKYN